MFGYDSWCSNSSDRDGVVLIRVVGPILVVMMLMMGLCFFFMMSMMRAGKAT